MTLNYSPFAQNSTPKEWVARWAISLTTPLTSLRMHNEIAHEMRLFAQRMPEYHAVIMSGVLNDLLSTLDPEDPWMNLHLDKTGIVRLPSGAAFGTWQNATDLAVATNADKGRDLFFAPMADPLTDASVGLIYHASHSRREAEAFMIGIWTKEENGHHIFEIAEDAIRWALARRQAYSIVSDGFFPITAAAWANRATKVVAGGAPMWFVKRQRHNRLDKASRRGASRTGRRSGGGRGR
jgi:hypothetical protein